MELTNRSSNPLCLLIFISLYVSFFSLQALASGNETDRLSLLEFKQSITNDPNGIFNSWNSSLHFCSWFGVNCSRRHQRVTSLILQGHNLTGSISPYIGNLSFLRILNLGYNSFHGRIPQEIGKLFRLNSFIANTNSLSGEIPGNISNCNQLKTIILTYNQLEGRIPPELGGLAELELLYLGVNNFGGRIPTPLANLSSLTSFIVARNDLVGNIPSELVRLTSLAIFMVFGNQLSGNVPPALFNISSIFYFSTAGNTRLNGTIPETIGLTLPNLEVFYMGGNEFSGPIPNSLSNASNLQRFDIAMNKFVGKVPNFGNQPNLVWLGIPSNFLGSNSSDDLKPLASLTNSTKLEYLGLANNNFGGDLPGFIANLSTNLERLHFGENQFTGFIPEGLQNFVNLIDLLMESNLFTGVIPSNLGKLHKLQRLLLWENRLSDEIPPSLGNLTQLFILSLSTNRLTGSIPSSIGNCTSLNALAFRGNELQGNIPKEIMLLPALTNYLILVDNSLSGNLPAEVGKLVNLNYLDVSGNKLSGEIPTSIGDCLAMELLFMSGNSFQGSIPSSLASLRGLQQLDLSRNNLTGEIPSGLQDLRYLQYLNLSFNDLQGEVPTEGVFKNVTALSLTGNSKLCGGIKELLLQKCPTKSSKKGIFRSLKIAIIAICAALGCIFIFGFLIVNRRKKPISRESFSVLSMKFHVKVSYRDLYQATNGFSSENLIGSGSFGSVYKGYLKQIEKPIAIKVLKLQQKDALKTFIVESNVLKNVKHRNLVKLISYCSSLDSRQNEFKALVFEYMENGSLDNWLHHGNLNFLQRLDIAIDVASALHYLHDLTGKPIIHCDLKPSNVLLDANMVAHVSDFGLARSLMTSFDASKSQSSTLGIKGTIGYAPPEYAMGSPASREGDVYSYGILVLEIFTGKKPISEMFKDGLNLHNFVKSSLPQRVMQLVDRALVTNETQEIESEQTEHETNENWENCLVSVFEVGIACSVESPKERMKMVDVVKKLHFIRSSFLRVRVTQQHS